MYRLIRCSLRFRAGLRCMYPHHSTHHPSGIFLPPRPDGHVVTRNSIKARSILPLEQLVQAPLPLSLRLHFTACIPLKHLAPKCHYKPPSQSRRRADIQSSPMSRRQRLTFIHPLCAPSSLLQLVQVTEKVRHRLNRRYWCAYT